MNNKNKNDSSKEELKIDLEELEKLIISYTQEVIEQYEYMKILEDKDDTKKEEITKTYKLR